MSGVVHSTLIAVLESNLSSVFLLISFTFDIPLLAQGPGGSLSCTAAHKLDWLWSTSASHELTVRCKSGYFRHQQLTEATVGSQAT